MAKATSSLFSNSQQSFNSGSGNSWSNPANVGQVSGAATTTVSSNKNEGFSDTLRVTGFTDSGISTASLIVGIEVQILRSADVADECFDDTVAINVGASTSTNNAKATAWPTSSNAEEYGGQTDLWGLSGVTGADLAALEIDIAVTSDNATDVTASITEVRATFYYLPIGLGDEAGWWCPSLDDTGNGTVTLNDLSGSGDDGTLTNMDAATDWVSDTDSGGVRALDFDGSDDYVDTTAALPSTTTLSVSLWVKTQDQALDSLASWDLSGSNRSFHLRKKATGEAEVFTSPDGTTTAYHRFETTTLIDDNVWHHLVATFDSGTIHIWIDGIDQSLTGTGVGSPAGLIHENSNYLQFAATNGTQNPITARIDDARIFDRVLSAAEIEHLASARGVLGGAGGSFLSFLMHQSRIGVVES